MKFTFLSSKMTFLHTWFFGFSLSFTLKGPFRGLIIDIKFVRWIWTVVLSIPPKNIRKSKNMFANLDFNFEEYIDDDED
jgi:hypothetical protein